MNIWQILSRKFVLNSTQYVLYKDAMNNATNTSMLVGAIIGSLSAILYPMNLTAALGAMVMAVTAGGVITITTHISTIRKLTK